MNPLSLRMIVSKVWISKHKICILDHILQCHFHIKHYKVKQIIDFNSSALTICNQNLEAKSSQINSCITKTRNNLKSSVALFGSRFI